MEGGGGSSKQTELQVYLSESIVEDDESATFDVLKWWKGNSERFPILSKMARDVQFLFSQLLLRVFLVQVRGCLIHLGVP